MARTPSQEVTGRPNLGLLPKTVRRNPGKHWTLEATIGGAEVWVWWAMMGDRDMELRDRNRK